MRHNVKVYKVRDGHRTLAAKDKISAKRLTVNLTTLDGGCFGLEIGKFSAKALNGKTIEVICGPAILKHKIAFEGNTYYIETDFGAQTILAIH